MGKSLKKHRIVSSPKKRQNRTSCTEETKAGKADNGAGTCESEPNKICTCLQSILSDTLEDAVDKALPYLHRAVNRDCKKSVGYLLTAGVDVHEKDIFGKAAIQKAVIRRQLDIVDLLLSEGADVNYKDFYGRSLIYAAAERGDDSLLALLLKHNANIWDTNRWGESPLSAAITNRHPACVRELLDKGADANAVMNLFGEPRHTALHSAIESGCLEIAKMLLDRGANINAIDNKGTPLFLACSLGNVNAVILLLNEGADVNAREGGDAPIHVTVQKKRSVILRLLLTRNAVVDIIGKNGTPFYMACASGNLVAVKLLLSRTNNLTCGCGKTPLYTALENGHYDVAHFLVKRIGVNVDETIGGHTLLHLACRDGDLNRVQFLVHNRARVNAVKDGLTPLHYACYRGSTEIVTHLLKAGANVNAKSETDGTPIHIALNQGNLKLFNALRVRNVDVDAKDNRGRTTLQLAVETGSSIIVCHVLAMKPSRYDDGNRAAFLVTLEDSKYAELFKPLYKYGFRLTLEESAKPDYLFRAIERGHSKLVECLLGYGEGVQSRAGKYSATPLHTAASVPSIEIVELLLERGADTNVKCARGKTPVFNALKAGCWQTVEALLYHGADVNVKSNLGVSVLQTAIRKNVSLTTIKILLDQGADPNVRTRYDESLLFFALKRGFNGIAKLLLKYGSKCSLEELKELIIHGDIPAKILKRVLTYDFTTADMIIEMHGMHLVYNIIVEGTCESLKLINLHNARTFVAGTCVREVAPRQFDTFTGVTLFVPLERCVTELDHLAKKRIGSTTITFRDILLDDIDKLATYLNNPEIATVVDNKVNWSEFPIYGDVIGCNVRQAKTRKSLLTHALENFVIRFPCLPKLCPELKEIILNYLDNRDLRLFIATSKYSKRKDKHLKKL